MRTVIICLLTAWYAATAAAQSLEIMPGNNFIFADIQFFEAFDQQYRTTLFSRTRARLTYEDEKNGIDFFSGAYLNYSLKSGFGGTVLARINNFGSDVDVGIHFYKQTKTILRCPA